MKILHKPSFFVAMIIALVMLAHAPVSRAQGAGSPADSAAGATLAGEPAEPGTGEEPASRASSGDDPAPDSADEYLARGLAHYKAREFEKAIKAFHAGYKLESRREFLFALGQAERRSGDCASALTYYRRFIDTAPPARQEQAARMHMRSCEKALVSAPTIRSKSPERAVKRAPRVPARKRPATMALTPRQAQPPAAQVSPWYHDTAGGVLLSTGTVAVLAGAGLMVASGAAQDRASWAATYPEYDLEIARARRYQLWGVAAVGAGTALIAGAIYRYHRRSGQHSAEAREIGVAPGPGGLTISYGGRF